MKKPKLGIFPTHENHHLPKAATDGSACFDLSYQPWGHTDITVWNHDNSSTQRPISRPSGKAIIMPGERAMIPTGLIMDIPEGYCVKVYPRSSTGLKRGCFLANGTGIIDSDYTDEVFMLFYNGTGVQVSFDPRDRIAQAELVPVQQVELTELKKAPKQKTDREGGMGSTGSK